MLTEVKNNIKYFFSAIKVGIKSAMAYKASFIIQALFMMINNLFFLVFWGVVFSKTGSDTSISFNNVLFLWGFSAASYGIAYFFFGGMQKINEYIINGTMDSFLLQPKNVLLNVLTSKCVFSAFGDLLYGIIIALVAVKGDIGRFIFFLVISITGSVFFISTEIILRSLTVWLGDTKTIAGRYIDMLLITFSTYPENIFRTGIKVMLYTVVPVAYLAYIPSKIMVGFNLYLLIAIVVAELVYSTVAYKVFNKAIKNYESGNSLSMKN